MANVKANENRTACPACGTQFTFPASYAGRKGRCTKCGEKFVVPSPAESPFDDDVSGDDGPQYIGVDCHLCGTRMYGVPGQVGKELKCPDCNARTVVPPPPPPKKKNIPAAMEGDQYELWEPNEHPRQHEAIFRQPTYIAVHCTRCDTMMYATEKQVGQSIVCPDCGRSQVVPPPRPKPKPHSVISDRGVPMLDPASAPGPRPSSVTPEMRKQIEEEERNSEYGKALEKSRRTGKRMEVDVRGRPVLPRWPLFSGILPFLFTEGVPIRWLGLSVGYVLVLLVLAYALAMAATGGFGAVVGMCFFAGGCVSGMVLTAIAFSMLLVIVADTSAGAKQVQNWPPLHDWFGDFFVLVVAVMMSGFPGWAICHVLPGHDLTQAAIFAASIVVCFPITLLSQLEIGSMWGVLSPKVVKSLFICPFSWMTFFVLTALMAAALIGTAYGFAKLGINPIFILAPMGVAMFLLYGRLLGRLAWTLAESTAKAE